MSKSTPAANQLADSPWLDWLPLSISLLVWFSILLMFLSLELYPILDQQAALWAIGRFAGAPAVGVGLAIYHLHRRRGLGLRACASSVCNAILSVFVLTAALVGSCNACFDNSPKRTCYFQLSPAQQRSDLVITPFGNASTKRAWVPSRFQRGKFEVFGIPPLQRAAALQPGARLKIVTQTGWFGFEWWLEREII